MISSLWTSFPKDIKSYSSAQLLLSFQCISCYSQTLQGHNTHSLTFIQRERLSSQTQESNTLLMQNGAILLSRILCSKLNIPTRTALSPQDHWSILRPNMVPYWHWHWHSRLSICLINSVYFKHTKRLISMKADLKWAWSSDNAKPNMYIAVCDDQRRLQQSQWKMYHISVSTRCFVLQQPKGTKLHMQRNIIQCTQWLSETKWTTLQLEI